MLKTVKHVENYVKISRCVENVYVRHVENYVKISRCVENVYVRHVENLVENCVEVRKKHHHTLRCVLKLSGRFHFSSSILHTFLGSYICEQECIPVGCVPPICCPYLPACTALGGISPWGGAWSQGVSSWGDAWLGGLLSGGVPGPKGVSEQIPPVNRILDTRF